MADDNRDVEREVTPEWAKSLQRAMESLTEKLTQTPQEQETEVVVTVPVPPTPEEAPQEQEVEQEQV